MAYADINIHKYIYIHIYIYIYGTKRVIAVSVKVNTMWTVITCSTVEFTFIFPLAAVP
jgi:hypothetical protein